MLVALSWQSYLVAAHVHPTTNLSAISTGIGDNSTQAPARDRHLPGTPETCPICQEIAQAGHYLPPTPIFFDAPLLAVALLVAGAMPLLPLLRPRSHDWQSRAPPSRSRT
jgi:hypothetical protein